MNEIVFFFRKKIPGAYSINQIFETLAVEIGKTLNVRTHELSNAGAGPRAIASNIAEAGRAAGGGIHHITGDVHYIALALRKRRIVLTIHDCVILSRTPRWNPKLYAYLWLWYKLPIRLADAVTTISQKSKDEITAFTGCNPDKIKVIPNFVNDVFRYSPKTFDTQCPRILQIGTKPNKNLERVTEALSGLNCIFEIIGKLSQAQINLLTAHKINFENAVYLPLEELVERYRQADLLVFASTYEGFGMPVVEAQAIGRPVVTSNLEPMLWVAGEGAAIFADPCETSAIRLGIERIICDDKFRSELIEKGRENVKRFSIKKVAASYMEIYSRIFDQIA